MPISYFTPNDVDYVDHLNLMVDEVNAGGGGSGTVTSASVVTANGLAGTVANATTTPAITLTTTVSGILKGNGTAISAATSGDFPTLNQNTTGSAAVATTVTTTNDVATATAVYPMWSSATSGNNGVKTSSTKLSFVPSTGVLTATGFAGSGASLTSIPNGALTNSSITIGSTSISLGATAATIAGLTSVTSTTFIGALTGNASTATTAGNVTGTVAVANGGTSLTTLTSGSVLVGNGTSAPTLVAPSTSGNVLTSNGTTWISSPASGGGGGGGSLEIKDEGVTIVPSATSIDFVGAGVSASHTGSAVTVTITGGGGSGGTVTSASVVSANGFAGVVANATTTPAITLTTSVSGLLKGNGTALSAATAGTDYSAGTAALATGILKSTTTTGGLSIATAGDFPTLNQNTTGTASNVTGTVAVANGGTGSTSLTAGSVVIGNGTSAVSLVAPSTSGNVLTSNGTTWVSSPSAGGGSGGSVTPVDVTTTGYGETSTLPDATTLTVGATRTYRNTGSYPRSLKDFSGAVVGFIPANSSVVVVVENVSTAAGIWQLSGVEPVAIMANKAVIAAFGGTSVTDYSTEVIDADRQIFFAKGSSSIFGIVYDHTNNTWGSPTLIRTGGSYTGISIKCATDKILHVSCDTSTNFSAVVLSISGTSITVNTAVTMTTGASFGAFGAIKEMGVGGFVVSYRAAAERYVGITVSGTTPTLGTEVTGVGATVMGSLHDMGGGVVLSVTAAGSGINLKTMTLSGATLTANNTANTAASSTVFRTLEMSSGRVALYYLNTVQRCGFISVSGTTPSFNLVNTFTTSSTATVDTADMVEISSTTVGIATGTGGGSQNLFTTLTDTAGVASVGGDLVVATQGGADSARFVSKSGTTVFWEVGQATSVTAVVEISYATSSASHVGTYSVMPMTVTRVGATLIVGGGNNPQSLKSSIGTLSIGTITGNNPWQRLYASDSKGVSLVKPIPSMAPTAYLKGRSLTESWLVGNIGGGFNLYKVEIVE